MEQLSRRLHQLKTRLLPGFSLWPFQNNRSPSFVFSIYSRQALLLLEHIYPFLRTYKSARATLILHHYLALTPRNGKYSDEMRSARLTLQRKSLGIKPHHARN